MQVWIVEAGWNYDSGTIEGVYSSLEKAQVKIDELSADPYDYDYVDYVEMEVE